MVCFCNLCSWKNKEGSNNNKKTKKRRSRDYSFDSREDIEVLEKIMQFSYCF